MVFIKFTIGIIGLNSMVYLQSTNDSYVFFKQLSITLLPIIGTYIESYYCT